MKKELDRMEKVISEIDYIYQEGCIFTKRDVVRLKGLVKCLELIVGDLDNPKLQIYFNQVR